jgi:hypothetical protein
MRQLVAGLSIGALLILAVGFTWTSKVERGLEQLFDEDGRITLFTMEGRAEPELSEPNTGRIYYDLATNHFKASENGGAYALFGSGSGATPGGSVNNVQINDGAGGLAALAGNTLSSHNFATSISASGVISGAQPAFSDLTGSATCAQLPALTGDATSSAGACATTLATSGVSAGTYTKLTVDAKGRATVGATAAAADLSNGVTGADAIVLATSPAIATPTITGPVVVPKGTASGTNPGAANTKLEVVCGTNAGTAKLIMYAGTSATPVTIVDNVGSGVNGC